MSVNKVILIGFLGSDPEVKTLDSSVKVARVSLATSESYTDKSGKKIENTEYILSNFNVKESDASKCKILYLLDS